MRSLSLVARCPPAFLALPAGSQESLPCANSRPPAPNRPRGCRSGRHRPGAHLHHELRLGAQHGCAASPVHHITLQHIKQQAAVELWREAVAAAEGGAEGAASRSLELTLRPPALLRQARTATARARATRAGRCCTTPPTTRRSSCPTLRCAGAALGLLQGCCTELDAGGLLSRWAQAGWRRGCGFRLTRGRPPALPAPPCSGPRKTIFHNPKDVTAAIVTCEGPNRLLALLHSALGACLPACLPWP